MKRFFSIILISLALMWPMALQAQDHPTKKHKQAPPDISTIVTDLSSAQKKKIEQINKEAHQTIHQLEKSLHSVRDSIRKFMDCYEDNSKIMFPLIEQEAKLQAEINKTKYRTKSAINKVLTPEQYKQVIAHAKKHRGHEKDSDGRKLKRIRDKKQLTPAADKVKPIKKEQ